MSQHHLDAAQIGPAFQQVGGEAVAQHVGRQAAEDAGLLPISRQEFPKTLASHRTAACGYEEVFARASLQKRGPALVAVLLDGGDGGGAYRDQALLVALPGGLDEA